MSTSIHWFRKALRLSDNPALIEACKKSQHVYPLFIMDPKFRQGQMSVNRQNFLLQCLHDLDKSLKCLGSRLFVLEGKPDDILPQLVADWNIDLITYEHCTGPYSIERDAKIAKLFNDDKCNSKVKISTHHSHTLYPLDLYLTKCGAKGIPKTYKSFCDLIKTLNTPRLPINAPISRTSEASETDNVSLPLPRIKDLNNMNDYNIPTLLHIRNTTSTSTSTTDNNNDDDNIPTATASDIFPGGETFGLKRLNDMIIQNKNYVKNFEKPNTSPNSLIPSTTVLSPYITMGCISVIQMYNEINKHRPLATDPPVSLIGQLLWREFFYLHSISSPPGASFDKMLGNPLCKQIPWDDNPILFNAWKNGQTGFPFIDAIMIQLKTQGWIHHLARHAVACFLTRGDLWQSWEKGAEYFEYTLLDGDWALNNANWQWLSCSRFFHQYGRCYSPIAFGKKTDPTGEYIRKWLPKLKNYPTKYIYEPWTAPMNIQNTSGCIIGVDYPKPIIDDHTTISKFNMGRMKAAYAGTATATATVNGSADTGDESSSAAAKTTKSRKVKAEDNDSTPSVSTYFAPAAKKSRKE